MKSQITDDFTKSVIQLGGLLMQFSHVKRVTYTDKKGTRETDTDHTTMLAIMACAIASELEPKLDLGKIAQYALVHDLVEVYAGDVNTINFHTIDHKSKQINEARALAKIKEEYGKIFPWIHTTIEQYEQLTDREARFVKTLDKLMPALTHVHTDNQVINENFDDPVEYEKSVNARNKHMRETFAHDQPAIMELRERIVADIVKMKYEYHVRKTTGTKGEKS